jgi:outer membrane protein
MKKRIISITLLAVMVIAAAAGTAADTNIADSMEFQGEGMELTLEQAIELGLRNNPTLLASQLAVDNANIEADKLNLAASSMRYLYERNSGSYLQYVDVPRKTANMTILSAQLSYEAVKNTVIAGIKQAYYSVQQAQEMVEINQQNMAISKDLFEKTKKKFELGMVAKQEVLSAELSCIKAKNDYNSAVNAYKTAKMSLNILLGNDVMTELILTNRLEFKDYEPAAIAEAVQKALENNYEIKIKESAFELAELNHTAARKMYDSINFNYRAAETAYKKAAAELDSKKKDIEMGVRSDYMALIQKKREVESGQKAVELAEQGLTIAQATYDAGMSVITDVEQAQTTLKQAKLGLSKAVLDYNLAISKFEDSMGTGRISAAGTSGGNPYGG